MKKILLLLAIVFIASIETIKANNLKSTTPIEEQTKKDSLRIAELDRFWEEISRTVREGDFEGYKSAYHIDAVVIFASGKNKTSVPISTALNNWKQGFLDTKAGKRRDNVELRFSQRIGDETTAHETGIFKFSSVDSNGKVIANYITHFEMLLVKRNKTWHGLMEYQKSNATQEEWDALN